MRLTAFTDFGLRTLMYLTSIPAEQLSSVPEVAKVYDASQNHFVKVIGQLTKLGYVQSIRGKNGGIRLAKKAEDINVGKVIRELENHLDAVNCSKPACQIASCCELKQALALAMEAFLTKMEEYSLADIVQNKPELIPLWQAEQDEDLN
ncbi:transcriptional repressor NsrR [Marinomonas sp. SBI22]|uniref:Rrf2 family transcriptional regulator n=1 Tax=unclassified Marinomonas TaxID=196814 RepID=UPI0007AF13B8|nr:MULTISPECIES: Rrf2 family transcriptional regulator [unclassified Marinomonas]KZM38953.1 transcriptional repressor NsrR [Marinomonas sp. SBI22]KZM39640.1 transcriptional repressor NsrR [Marinomonas sp. SBI8L]